MTDDAIMFPATTVKTFTVKPGSLMEQQLSYREACSQALIDEADLLFQLGYLRDAESRYSYAVGLCCLACLSQPEPLLTHHQQP